MGFSYHHQQCKQGTKSGKEATFQIYKCNLFDNCYESNLPDVHQFQCHSGTMLPRIGLEGYLQAILRLNFVVTAELRIHADVLISSCCVPHPFRIIVSLANKLPYNTYQ